ncbi:nucleoside recognition domain protein [Clostridium sp. CAG:440]|nr:nucleoside recognition domain protein [Clostridium sp. CAG:440]HJJ15295.1 nucleoside recognition protein [Clostridiaceae bacterium]
MLNILWPIFIIISFAYAIFSGNVDKLNESIFSSTSESVNLCISLLGTICLWNGIMQIANKTSIIDRLTNLLKPAMNFLFPELKQEKEIQKEISLNVIANILGLGNAATPLGLKAMKSMQKKNPKKDTLTNSMITFIVLNTASLQIIPTTVIAIRSSMNSKNPTSIVFPVWIATICAAIAGITATKLFIKLTERKK